MFENERPYRPQKRGRRVAIQESGFRWLVVSARQGRATRRARVAVPPAALQRRVVLKARYVSMTHASALRAAEKHLDYVERDGVERDGGKGVLHGREAPDHLLETPQPAEVRLGAAAARGAPEPSDQPLITPTPPGAAADVEVSQSERLRQSMLRPIAGEKHQFRIIISAEDAGRLDLTSFITRVMARVERDIGQPLIWAAANHYNTDDPHSHLVIRGVDRNGRVVRFDKEYISRVWRERAQEIVTQELGPRTEHEIEKQLQREVEQGRYTSLDRSIAARAEEGVVRSTELHNIHQRARLKVLVRMGLAEQLDASRWKLREGWQAQLRADGERGDIIKQMYAALGTRVKTERYRPLKRFEPMPGEDEVTGRVVSLGLMDSTPGALYAVIETTKGEGYYVPLWQSEVATLKRGDLVSLKELNDSWVKPLDQPLAELAKDSGVVSGRSIEEAMRTRLVELERAGLAARTTRGTWQVPADFRERWAKHAPSSRQTQARAAALDELLELGSPTPGEVDLAFAGEQVDKRLQELRELGLARTDTAKGARLDPELVKALQRRDKEMPRAHVALRRQPMSVQAQIHYRGPTWLDTADLDTSCPLTAELRALRSKRDAFLEHLGIRGKPKEKARALVALERDEVAHRFARQRKLDVAQKLAGFQGRVSELYQAPSGNRYAIVEDERALVVIRAGNKARKLIGREIEVSFTVSEYDGQKKLTLTPLMDRGRGR